MKQFNDITIIGIQTTATVDDILFSKAEQRAEQITADTRNDAIFTRKPTEPTR